MNPALKIISKLISDQSGKERKKLVAKKPDEDFIPYSCHYDPNTILTKNGELLQIIRVTGFNNNSITSELTSLREAVRDAIVENVKENKFALWFNTIRRKKDISPGGDFNDFLSNQFNQAWNKKNQWNDQYVNELYITLIIEGLDTSIVNFNGFIRSFSYPITKSLHRNFLSEAHSKLSQITQDILLEVEEYGAKLLGIKELGGVLYSEPMRFFGKIANLYEEHYPLSANDISNDLASHKIAFGNRELEVSGHKNKNFATILSLKEYSEVSTNTLDHILQLPIEFIITQSFDFAFSKKELEPCKYQDYILQVSGDEELRQISGISEFFENKTSLRTDYGKLQTTFMLISNSQEELEEGLKSIFEQFHFLGFVVVREDIFLEHCFWSQLPGNFRYLCRQKIINTELIGGFAALHDFPSGSIAENHWGPAVTALKTVLNTAYFFSFHNGDLGHSLILGPKNSGKTTLLNFLLTQARRSNHKLFYFDFNNKGKCLINALSGHYYNINGSDQNEESLRLNPFSLEHNEENKNFLTEFFTKLINQNPDPAIENEISFIPQVIDQIWYEDINNFYASIEMFSGHNTKNIYKHLKAWINSGAANIFTFDEEMNWSDYSVVGFDFTDHASTNPAPALTFDYLLHKVENILDGTPTIIALNHSWSLLNNSIILPRIGNWLENLRQKNCLVIFVGADDATFENNSLLHEIATHLATRIFLPNPNPGSVYQKIFGLEEEEVEMIKMMERESRHFFFKQGNDSIISSLDLSGLSEFLRIFSADQITLVAMEEVISANISESQLKPEAETWLPQFFEMLREIENERPAIDHDPEK